MASHRLEASEHLLSKGRKFVVDLLIAGVVGAVPVLYAADRIIKARAQARRLRAMSERLDNATARAEQQQEKRQEVAKFSAALTSVMPAIKRPPLSLPNASSPGGPPPDESSGAAPSPDQATGAAPSPGESSNAVPSPGKPPHGEPLDSEPPDRTLLLVMGPHGTGPHSRAPHGTGPHKTGCAHTGPQDRANRRPPSHTGEHTVRSADRAAGR